MANDIVAATSVAMQNAIVFCAEKANLKSKEQVLEARLRGDCKTCEYLRYGLAKGIAEYLGSMDNRAKAVYIYDDHAASHHWHNGVPNCASIVPGIRMIVWVTRKSHALNSLLDTLATAVDKELRQFPCPSANALCHMLDVIVVDDEEVTQRIGYGALINSVYLAPIELWHR